MSPANAKRVPSRVGVHLMTLFRHETGSWLKHACPELDYLIMGALRILDVKVKVDLLLLGSARPLWRSVIRSKLHTDKPRATFVQHAMEFFVIGHDVALEHRRPKSALGANICRVKHDDVSDRFHAKTVASESSSPSTFDDQDGNTAGRRRHERRARNGASERTFKLLAPSPCSWWSSVDPSFCNMPRHDEIGSDQSTAGHGQTSQEGHRNGKGRVRDDVKRSPR